MDLATKRTKTPSKCEAQLLTDLVSAQTGRQLWRAYRVVFGWNTCEANGWVVRIPFREQQLGIHEMDIATITEEGRAALARAVAKDIIKP